MPGNCDISILIISLYAPPETGAAPNRVKSLAAQWSRSGNDVTILAPSPDGYDQGLSQDYENKWLTREKINGIKYIRTKTIPAPPGARLRRVIKAIWFMILSILVGLRASKKDVIISTSPNPLTGVSGLVLAKIFNCKFVFDVRDLWPESILELDNSYHGTVLVLRKIVSQIYKNSDMISIVVPGFKNVLSDYNVNLNKVRFHPNGRDSGRFLPPYEPTSERLSEAFSQNFVISYIGTVGKLQALDILLESAKHFDKKEIEDLLFVIVGDGDDRERLQEKAGNMQIDNLMFAGFRDKKEIPILLSMTDISVVHLKESELFEYALPSKMFESMASGVPIALGLRGDARRVIEDANAGLAFEPENSDELNSVINKLYKNDQMRKDMGQSGKKYFNENHTWNQIGQNYYYDLCALTQE